MKLNINKKILVSFIGVFLVILCSIISIVSFDKKDPIKTKKIAVTVLGVKDKKLTVQDENDIIYTFNLNDITADIGDNLLIEYTGVLDKNSSMQANKVIRYSVVTVSNDEDGIPSNYQDNGIFSNYYILAYDKLQSLSLDEKIGQLFLVRYPDSNQVADLVKYKFGGFVFFKKDFDGKDKSSVKSMISTLQKNANIPLITAVDEEGGTVVRVSSNPLLASEKFKSSQDLYKDGGLDLIAEDTNKKSKLLNDLGLNLNLAPVVDVSTNTSAYMYNRSLGQDTDETSKFAKTVIEASLGGGVSYTLKHFPGYGNNPDTHTTGNVDTRTFDEIMKNDLPPFREGIKAGAEAVLVSHNTVDSIDPDNAASLSNSVHNLLRNELSFTGVIITDDLDMGAVSNIDDKAVKAILAGNNLIITTDYEKDIRDVKVAIDDGRLSEELIDRLAFKILSWKYYKGLMFEHQK